MPAPAWVAAPLGLISAPTKAVVQTWTNTNVSPAMTTALTTGGLSTAAQAALLIHRVIGGQTDAEMAARRELIKAWPATDLTAEVNAYIKSDADSKTATAGTVVLMPSFRHANSMERTNAKDTVERAIQMLTKAFLACKFAVKSSGTERTNAVTWFGAFDATRFEKVAGNLKKLHDTIATKPIRLYYRGPKVKGPEDKPQKSTAATPLAAFASAFTATDLPGFYDRKFGHVTLGQSFFDGTSTTPGGKDSFGGVLLHELSHHICDTADEERPDNNNATYGHDDCKWLASNYPVLACNNADNLEYYCESFQ